MRNENTERFTGRSNDYAAARPVYADAFLAWLQTKGIGAGTAIADVGAGTGKLTAQLLELGAEVWAVEPNTEMRRQLSARLGTHRRCKIVDAPAEATTLAPSSVEVVTAAQAFHWFDAAAFARECARILVPGGKVCLVWNLRVADVAVNAATEQITRMCCPNFNGFSANITSDDAKIDSFFAVGYEKKIFPHDLTYSRENFVRRQLSSSYAPTDLVARNAYAAALGTLFDRFCQNGTLTVPNETVVWWGNVCD